MVDGYLTLGGKELPFRRTLGACRRFDEKFKGEISVLEMGQKDMQINHLIYLMYLFIEAGCRAVNEPCEIDVEWLEDNVTMTDLNSLTKALTGAPDREDEQPKKKYKGGE